MSTSSNPQSLATASGPWNPPTDADPTDMDPALEEQSSAAGGVAQALYEEAIFLEAIGMVRGTVSAQPSVEHLRVVFEKLWTEDVDLRDSECF